MVNLILFITALTLGLILVVCQFIYGIFNAFFSVKKYKGKFVSKYLLDSAIKLDKCGNIMCGSILNLLFRTKLSRFEFGRYETVSSCLGKNQKYSDIVTFYGFFKEVNFNHTTHQFKIGVTMYSNLTVFGSFICNLLDTIEHNHCIKSIEE